MNRLAHVFPNTTQTAITDPGIQQLKRLLIDAEVTPNKEKLSAYDDMQTWQSAAARQMRISLPVIRQRHRVRCVKFPKDARDRFYKLKDGLANALQGFDPIPLPLNHKAKQLFERARALLCDVELECSSFEGPGPQAWYDTKRDINTHLYLDFYRLYSELTGRTGLGDADGNGPLYRFTKEGVALVGSELQFPKPGAFRKLMTENKAV
jgi:hypothetical protein